MLSTPASLRGTRIREVREIVAYPEDRLPCAECYLHLDNGRWIELQTQDPQKQLILVDCLAERTEFSIRSPASGLCAGKCILDIVRSGCWSTFGVLLDNNSILFMEADIMDGLRACVLQLESPLLYEDDLTSWIDGSPIKTSENSTP